MPLSVCFVQGTIKVELALVSSQRGYGERQDMAPRDAARDMLRELGGRARSVR